MIVVAGVFLFLFFFSGFHSTLNTTPHITQDMSLQAFKEEGMESKEWEGRGRRSLRGGGRGKEIIAFHHFTQNVRNLERLGRGTTQSPEHDCIRGTR